MVDRSSRKFLENDSSRCPKEGTKLRKIFDAFKQAPMTPINLKTLLPNVSVHHSTIFNLTVFYGMEFVKTKNHNEYMLVSHCDEDYMKDKFCGIS